MSKLERLLDSLARAEQRVTEKKAELEFYLQPILQELKFSAGYINRVSVRDGQVFVERVGSFRGREWEDEQTFPLSIFNAKDPLIAAREYVAETQKRRDEEELARINRDLAALQNKREALLK